MPGSRVPLALALVALVLVPSAAGVTDPTPPVVTFAIAGQQGEGGWYRSNVTVSWSFSDPESGIASTLGCDTVTLAADTPGTRLACSATNFAGVTSSVSLTIKIDKTSPEVVGATPERPPDTNGWYRRAVTFAFAGADAMSGLHSCTSATYNGPDSEAAAVAGTCRDVAGNSSSPRSAGLKFDASPPVLEALTVDAGDRVATLRWKASPDSESVEVVRAAGQASAEVQVYQGVATSYTDKSLTNGVRYHYRVTSYDRARNSAERSVEAVPKAPLFRPASGKRVEAPPVLSWRPVRGARLYNVQLFRAGRKLLSAWPTKPHFRVRRSWRFQGLRYRLRPGRYRWYVWPGYRRGARVRYGKVLVRSSFVVARPR
jgi:hypothetical protein